MTGRRVAVWRAPAFLGQEPGVAVLCGVPRLSEFYVYMYWQDHQPPHFHAIYGGEEALVRIDDATFLAGSLPRTAARLVREWVELRRSELQDNWERAQAPAKLVPMDPLR